MIDVCDIQVMKPLLESYGFHFSKAKGQNFLTAAWVPEAIAREAGVDGGSGVLEIGPGIGSLTQQLCLRAGKVCAVELDRRLEPILRKTVGEFSNLELIWDDAMKLDLAALVREKFPGAHGTAGSCLFFLRHRHGPERGCPADRRPAWHCRLRRVFHLLPVSRGSGAAV